MHPSERQLHYQYTPLIFVFSIANHDEFSISNLVQQIINVATITSLKITVGRTIISLLFPEICHDRNFSSAANLVSPYSLNGFMAPFSSVPGSANPYTATLLVNIIFVILFHCKQLLDWKLHPHSYDSILTIHEHHLDVQQPN